MDPMTIAQYGIGALSGLLGKKKETQPPMQSGPRPMSSFGVEMNQKNPPSMANNLVQSNPPNPNANTNGLPANYNSYGGNQFGAGYAGNNMVNPQAPNPNYNQMEGPMNREKNNSSPDINGSNPDGHLTSTEDDSSETNVPALLGSGAGALYDILKNDKPEYKREVDPYTKQMVSQSSNATSMTNANANNIAGSVMAGASGSADKAMTASLGNTMATGGGVDNMALGAYRASIENNQMNTAYAGGMAQGGSIASQASANHAQTLGRASDQTMYREQMPTDTAGMMALQGLSALPKAIADGETAQLQSDWRKRYDSTSKAQDSIYHTNQAMQRAKGGTYNPLNINTIFSSLLQGTK